MDRVALIPVIEEISGRDEAIEHAQSLLIEFALDQAEDETTKKDAEPVAPAKPDAPPAKAGKAAKPAVDPKQELRRDTEAFLTVLEDGPDELDKKERQRLIRRYRWYADLALSSRAEDSDPIRSKALFRAKLTVGVLIIGLISVVLAGVVGSTLLISWIVARVMGKIQMRYPEDSRLAASGRLVYFETFVLLLGAMIVVPAMLAVVNLRMHWSMNAAMVLLVGWLVVRKVPWSEASRGLGWHGGKNPVVEVFCGICGYLAGLPIIVIGLILTTALSKAIAACGLDKVVSKEASHPIVERLQQGGTSQILILGLMACVLAPILEETFFRGAFYHYLRSRGGVLVAVLISSFIFAAIHP